MLVVLVGWALVLAGCFICCGLSTTLGFATLLDTILSFAALLVGGRLMSGIVVFLVVIGMLDGGTLGFCTVLFLFKNDVIVGCCCVVCGACSNAFHSDHNCLRMLYLFVSVG